MDTTTPNSRWHGGAVLSFLLGVASLGLFALTGLPALFLGFRSLRAVNASDGRLRGARLAVLGMVLGGIGTLLTGLGIAAIAILQLQLSSQRMECTDNLREIGVAVNKYADTHKVFPPATPAPDDLPPVRCISWLADVLPLLREGTPGNARYQALAQQIDRDKAWDAPANRPVVATTVRMFLCPAHPEFAPNAPIGLTHYVGMAGIGLDAARLPRDHSGAGVFGYRQSATREEITRGLPYTMLALETQKDNGPWLAGGWPTVRGLNPDVEQYSGPNRPFGGLHSGIVNILWVDGSVRPLSNDTPAQIFRAHARIHADEP